MRQHTRITFAVGALVGLAAVISAQSTTRVSVDSAGNQGNGLSYMAHDFSVDDRVVVFFSEASNLAPGDTNGVMDVFVRDRVTGQVSRVSIDSAGIQGNAQSRGGALSSDGMFVAFGSDASNLVPGDTNGVEDCFVHDRSTGQTIRVNVDSAGNQANGGGDYHPRISGDGRFVSFISRATNLVPGDTNGRDDVFVHDRMTGQTIRITVDSAGNQGNGHSASSGISADGRFVAFHSGATNLVAGDSNGVWDVFVHDLFTGATERVSVSSVGAQGNGDSTWHHISADGRFVTFMSRASTLVANDTNGFWDVFVRDRQTGTTERVSVDSSGGQGNQDSQWPVISADGRFVAFPSAASNLVTGDTNGYPDVFLHDRASGQTTRVSVDSNAMQADDASGFGHWDGTWPTLGAHISPSGHLIGFSSLATNLVPGDTNGVSDAFVYDTQGCGNISSYCIGAINTTGHGASIGYVGSTSIAANDLVLLASGGPPNHAGIFFFGTYPTQIPFGEGYLCVTGNQHRLTPVVVLNASGAGSLALDYTNPASPASLLTAGSEWNFQFWYRDPQDVANGFNFTDALNAHFCP